MIYNLLISTNTSLYNMRIILYYVDIFLLTGDSMRYPLLGRLDGRKTDYSGIPSATAV